MVPRLLLVLLCLGAPLAWGDEKAEVFRPAFAPPKAEPVHVTDEFVVWAKSERIPSQLRGGHSRYWYWTQRTSDAKAVLRAEFVNHYPLKVATVLKDGTLMFHYGRQVWWVAPDAPVMSNVLRHEATFDMPPVPGSGTTEAFARYADPEGLVVQPWRSMAYFPLYWVPLEGTTPQMKKRVPITDERGVYCNTHWPFFRVGSKIAFATSVFDLKTKTSRSFPAVGSIRAFDGRYVAGRKKVVDTETGKVTDLPYGHQVFAFAKGRAHSVMPDGGPGPSRLFAFDGSKPVELHAAATPNVLTSFFNTERRGVAYFHGRPSPLIVIWNTRGIRMWDGQTWAAESWAKPPAK